MTVKVDSKHFNEANPVVSNIVDSWIGWYSYWAQWFYNGDSLMRQYIRHPSDIPIAYCLGLQKEKYTALAGNDFFASDRLRDVSQGGLCFNADCPVRKGTPIHIEISVEQPPYEADGMVAWCRPEGDHFAVGVQFNEPSTQYSVRMVEQVCHIEHYRTAVLDGEGRELTIEEAASEWIEKYAAEFPA
ncbi:PilZ domain-containing protein [Teredinibacter purpureus]|jgi:PilZ domain.|uniref:PilZ domain-containing protein n=1 Tax=Teredinibacter purpureus TaxID=2731756 RepID=UPI0005F7F756|nr:PilZ domain-containing protein [Teredinibacter purpureus]